MINIKGMAILNVILQPAKNLLIFFSNKKNQKRRSFGLKFSG
jgi:hypothetical protein